MKLVLIRTNPNPKSTEGKLFTEGVEECYTLEDTDRELEIKGKEAKVYGETAIPKGTYKIIMSYSNRFKKILPELLDVPYFTGIRIHPGNKPEDTEGCILVGSKNLKTDDNWISQSRDAYDKLEEKIMEALKKEEVWITVC